MLRNDLDNFAEDIGFEVGYIDTSVGDLFLGEEIWAVPGAWLDLYFFLAFDLLYIKSFLIVSLENCVDLVWIGFLQRQWSNSIILIPCNETQISQKPQQLHLIDLSIAFFHQFSDYFKKVAEVEVWNQNVATTSNQLVEGPQRETFNPSIAIFWIQ